MASTKRRVILSLTALCFFLNVGYVWYVTSARFNILLPNKTFGSIFHLAAFKEVVENSTVSRSPTRYLQNNGSVYSESATVIALHDLHSTSTKPNMSKFDEVFQNFSLSFKDLRFGRKVPSNNNDVTFQKFVFTLKTSPAVTLPSVTGNKGIGDSAVPQPKYSNPHPYNYTISERQFCSGNKSELLIVIVVCSGLENFEARIAIRNTWGSSSHLGQLKSRLVFLFGATTNQQLQDRILNESRHYRDIIQEDFLDTYRNLSLKSVALLKWVTANCLNAKYVLKTDDDMFINVETLYKTLARTRPVRSLLGTVIVGARPVQDNTSKWYTPKEDFPQSVYPKYCSGTAYVISVDLVPELYNVTLYTPLFWLEDIYITGVCAGKLHPRYLSTSGFTFSSRPATGCAYKDVISGHRVSMENMYKIWKELNEVRALKRKCVVKQRRKMPYKRRSL